MGLLAPKIESAQALKTMADEMTKPWYRKVEFWIGIIANIIALGVLTVTVIALWK